MTVGQLLEKLKGIPKDLEVHIFDVEADAFEPVSRVSVLIHSVELHTDSSE